MKYVHEYILSQNVEVEFINLAEYDIECYRGYGIQYNEDTTKAAKLITDADVWIVGTPIYNSFFSGALKNLFEYINYKTTAGKVAGMAILAAGNIGFTDVQTLLTQLLSYFQVIANPKAVYMTTQDVADGVVAEPTKERLRQMVDDTLTLTRKVRGS
jgi:NAD(P)H-dependent FMN reductase